MGLDSLLMDWHKATAEAKWGVQRVFHDVFEAAANGDTTLIYGADYRDGKPCLVNTVGTMLTTGGGQGIPSQHFGDIVSLFDRINRELESKGVNTRPGYVSPLAADVFLRNFGTLKDKPVEASVNEAMAPEAFAEGTYREPTDEEMTRDLIEMFMSDSPCEVNLDGLLSTEPANKSDQSG